MMRCRSDCETVNRGMGAPGNKKIEKTADNEKQNSPFLLFPESPILKVGMGEGIAAESPHIIKTEGCGSCVILTLYDAQRNVGAMAHIMLPSATKDASFKMQDATCNPQLVFQFADTAVPALLEEMLKRGCSRKNIIAKIAGGARMFPSYSGSSAGIGEQNVRSVRMHLEKDRISINGFDTGGSHGRNVMFYLDTGRMVVSGIGMHDREI